MTNEKCPVTGKANCKDRYCELHYMDAPVRLAPARSLPLATAAFVTYATCIPAANFLISEFGPVPVGFGLLAPAGVFVAGVAFTARDLLQRWGGKRAALGAIVLGTALSFLLGDPAIALASAAAFGTAELVDMAIFTALRRKRLAVAVAASNVVGAVLDSVVFLWLAFGSLAFLPGQVVGKFWTTVFAVALLALLRKRGWRAA